MIHEYLNRIIQGDCLEVMKDLPDNSVDLVLTDPPYELDATPPSRNSKMMYLDKYHSAKYKSICSGYDYDIVFGELKRILKKVNMFVFCSNKQIVKILNYFNDYITNILIWHKVNAPPFANGVWANDIEYIIHIREKGATFQGDSTLKRKVKRHPIVRGEHPTQKPIDIISQFIRIGSNKGDTVLDPFLGSGTTAVACKMLDRNYIGIELSEKYCEIARERIENTLPLFDNLK